MIDIQNAWTEKFQFDDVGAAYTAGTLIHTPRVFVPKAISKAETEALLEKYKVQLQPGVAALYEQIELAEVIWQLSLRDPNTLKPFQNDPWLKENYLDQGYDWGVIHEKLSGGTGIQPLGTILDEEWIQSQGYYYSFRNMGRDHSEFVVLDIHWTLTALLRVENRVILDEVWLHNSDAHTLVPMNMGVAAYMETCFEVKGMYHWQEACLSGRKSETYQFIDRYLHRIFPNTLHTLSRFLK